MARILEGGSCSDQYCKLGGARAKARLLVVPELATIRDSVCERQRNLREGLT